MRRRLLPALGLLAALALAARPAQAQFVDTHNGAGTPICCAWGYDDVGWVYTPSTSFTLTMIEARFGLGDYAYEARTVTAEIRSSFSGTILGTTSFASSSDPSTWIGGSFAGVGLLAGTSYFIDFLNVGCINGNSGRCLGVNTVGGPVTGEYGTFYTGSGGSFSANGSYYDPIIRLTGSTPNVVPEPATMTLMATGLVGIVGAGVRRRTRA